MLKPYRPSRRRALSLITAVLMMIAMTTACGNDENGGGETSDNDTRTKSDSTANTDVHPLVGTWEAEQNGRTQTIEFREDGTCRNVWEGGDGTQYTDELWWKTSGGILTLYAAYDIIDDEPTDVEDVHEYEVTDDGRRLTIRENGNELIFNRI